MRCLLVGGPGAGKYYDYDPIKGCPYIRIRKLKDLEFIAYINKKDSIPIKDLTEDIITYTYMPLRIGNNDLYIFSPTDMTDIETFQELLNDYHPIEELDEQLLKFYNVENHNELIDAQHNHVKKLQERLYKLELKYSSRPNSPRA